MATYSSTIIFPTKGNRDIIDITNKIQAAITESGALNGVVVAFIPGSTAGLTTIEYEPGLKKDMNLFLERILPHGDRYHHHDTWHDDNGAAHLQAAMIGPSITIPVVNGKMTLGTWQQVVCIDCDTRPRQREIVLQVVS